MLGLLKVPRFPTSFAAGLLGGLAALLSLASPRNCRAQEERPALVLSWSAPADCPKLERARQLVAENLGERTLPPPAPEQRVLMARATIVEREDGWELTLITSLDGQPGERTLSASTCNDVVGAAALVMAFAIDPGAAMRHGAAGPPASPPAVRPPTAVSRPTPSPPRSPAATTWFGLGASVRGAFGSLPGVSGGMALSLSLERGAWGGMLVGTAFTERSAPSLEKPSAGGELWLWAVAAAPCWLPYRERFRLRACLPLELQRLTAEGYGVDVPARATRSELLLGVEVAPGFGLSSQLELVAPLGLGFAFQRPEFYLERIGSVFRASAMQGRLGLGLLARF